MENENKKQEETKQETALEQAKRLQAEVDAFKEKVDGIDDVEVLHKMEDEIVAELDEFDKYIRDRKYELPESTEYEGKTYTRSQVADVILYVMNKIKVGFKYTLGVVQICKFWKNTANKEVSYGMLDSTLRILEQQEYTGYKECNDILMVNEYMKQLHEDYTKDLAVQLAASKKHNIIIERGQLLTKVESKKEDEK